MASGEPGSELAGADEANNVMLLLAAAAAAAAASIHAKARGEATTRREGGSFLFFSFLFFSFLSLLEITMMASACEIKSLF